MGHRPYSALTNDMPVCNRSCLLWLKRTVRSYPACAGFRETCNGCPNGAASSQRPGVYFHHNLSPSTYLILLRCHCQMRVHVALRSGLRPCPQVRTLLLPVFEGSADMEARMAPLVSFRVRLQWLRCSHPRWRPKPSERCRSATLHEPATAATPPVPAGSPGCNDAGPRRLHVCQAHLHVRLHRCR